MLITQSHSVINIFQHKDFSVFQITSLGEISRSRFIRSKALDSYNHMPSKRIIPVNMSIGKAERLFYGII